MAWSPSQETLCEDGTPPHQQAMIHACEAGDIVALQSLFNAAGIRKGHRAIERNVDMIYQSGPPATFDLLYASIYHRQPATLKYLLQIYPEAHVLNDTLLGPNYADPVLSILEVLYAHDPSVVDYRMEHTQGLYTLLMEYCGSGNPILPGFLLDKGANPNDDGRPLPIDPLEIAIRSKQPVSLILKMVQKDVDIRTFHVLQAVRHERTDLLDILLHHCQWKKAMYSTTKDKKSIKKAAYETGNKESIMIVGDYMKSQTLLKRLCRSFKQRMSKCLLGEEITSAKGIPPEIVVVT